MQQVAKLMVDTTLTDINRNSVGTSALNMTTVNEGISIDDLWVNGEPIAWKDPRKRNQTSRNDFVSRSNPAPLLILKEDEDRFLL